jgi:hypothetical protein
MNVLQIIFTMSILCSVQAFASGKLVGQTSSEFLPKSNQSLYDEATSGVYFGAQRTGLWPQQWDVGHFSVLFPEQTKTYFELDLQTRIQRGESLSAWVDYGIGFVYQAGRLYDQTHSSFLDSENSSLAALPLRLGLLEHYDSLHYLVPFVGVQATETFYRLSSSLSGAENQGSFLTYGPAAGLQLRGENFLNVSILLEVIYQQTRDGSGCFSSGLDEIAALGWFF